MDDIELLSGVLTKTGALIAGVGDDQWDLPTPCPDYNVRTLVNHMVSWVQVFDAGCHGRPAPGDRDTYQAGDPAGEFRAAANSLIAGWQEYGLDRPVRVTGGESPGPMVFNMTVMEYLTHGWDLATATGQPVPYTEEEAADMLARAETTLPPQYRGAGMPFGDIVPIDEGAPAIDRAVAFLGRRP